MPPRLRREGWELASMDKDKAPDASGGADRNPISADLPPEGPHAKKELIDNSKTPGAGALPEDKKQDIAEADVGPD
jgi:hypothetical protein